jgi:acetoin:2,6-dichlorophenolindophenol oxidoreductase subunit beta
VTAAAPTHIESLRAGLAAAFAEDPRLHLLGEDVLDPYGGAFKVTKGLSSAFPGRIHTTPISEASLIGVALGMCLTGLRPVVEIMFSDFLTLCADQLVNHAAKFTTMYGRPIEVPLLVRTPIGAGRGYGPTHSQTLDKMFHGIPGLQVVMPSIAHDSGRLLQTLLRNSVSPTLFLEHKLFYGSQIFAGDNRVSCTWRGDAEMPVAVLRNFADGRADAAIVATGGPSSAVAKVLASLVDEEIRLTAVFPAMLSPCPIEAIVEGIGDADRILIVEEGTAGFNWSSELGAALYDRLFRRLAAPVARLAAAPGIIPTARHLEDQVIVTATKVEAAVYRLLA